MSNAQLLPDAFTDLLPWVDHWALAQENDRFNKRVDADMADIQAFYDAILPRMTEVMEHLEKLPPSGLGVADQNLLSLALSYVETSRIFEVWKQQDVRADFFEPNRLNCVGYEGVQQ